MSTNNSSHASQPATLNLFGSDGRVEGPLRGDWRVAPASSVPSATSRCGDCSRPGELSQASPGSTKVNCNDYGMSFDKLRASRGLTTITFSLHLARQ